MISIQKIREKIDDLENCKKGLIDSIDLSKRELNDVEKDLYGCYVREAHLKEIYRLAKIHFSRLAGRRINDLTQNDIMELEKWIGRTKSNDGLRDIVEALNEIQKYKPSEVRNIYGLVQRIIIGGPFKSKRKK